MEFDDIWVQLCRKQPALANPETTVEFKSDNFKTLLRQVCEQGRKSAPADNYATTDDPIDRLARMFGFDK